MTQAIVVDESAKSKAEAERAGAQGYLDLVRGAVISSDEDEAAAVELLRDIKRQVEHIEKTKKFFVEPVRKLVNTYNNFFKEPIDALKECERELKLKVAAYVREKHERNQRALAEAAKTRDAEQARAVLATVTPAANPTGTSIRYQWVFEVTDPDAVPREFCSPDSKKLANAFAVGEGGKPMEIPGVKWSQKPIVSVRK